MRYAALLGLFLVGLTSAVLFVGSADSLPGYCKRHPSRPGCQVTSSTTTVPSTTTNPGTTTAPPPTTTAPPPTTTAPPPTTTAPSGTLPCGSSLDVAYDSASPGDNILLGSCAYTGATITGSKSATVTLEAAPGTSPTVVGDITNFASFLTLRGISTSQTLFLAEGGPSANNVVFDRMHAAHFLIGPGHDVTLSNSDIDGTGSGCQDENKVGPDGNIPNLVPYNINLIGNYIHDQNCQNIGGPHFGGLFLIAGHDFLIAGNRFERNVVYDIQVQNFTGIYGGLPQGLTIENNWFVGPVEWLPNGTTYDNQPNVQVDCRSNACANRDFLIRYNSFYDGVDLQFDGANTQSNVRVIGNVGRSGYCVAGASFASNVWGSGTCSSTDRVGSPAYVNGSIASPDFHLSGGVAVDLVPGSTLDQQLATDIDGQARPVGPGYDAGSDER